MEKITSITIMGDKLVYHNAGQEAISLEELATRGEREDGTPCWFSNENGQEIERKTYDDLSFLTMIPNLNTLQIAMADLRDIPNLRPLEKLEYVRISDCEMQGMQWLEGSTIRDATFECSGNQDYTPLRNCDNLQIVHIDLSTCKEADFSGFAPPQLKKLIIEHWHNTHPLDLSSLGTCAMLSDVFFRDVSLQSLTFLEEKKELEKIELERVSQLTDLSPLSGLPKLTWSKFHFCENLRDFSPLATCRKLREVYIDADNNSITNMNWLGDLPEIESIHMYGASLPNLDFLDRIEPSREISFGLTGIIGDYSALGRRKGYEYIAINIGPNNYSMIAPYLEKVTVKNLRLHCGDADLRRLPNVTETLQLVNCTIVNMADIRKIGIQKLVLIDTNRLISLDGIQNFNELCDGEDFELEIYNCLRLSDYTVLEGKHLKTVQLHGVYTIPDLSKTRIDNLMLDYVEGIEDLSCLGLIDPQYMFNELQVYMPDEFTDLLPASHLKGDLLSVSPQFAEQAQALVDEGHFQRMEINYPDHSWQQDDSEFTLLNLEELDTLPKKLLAKVSNLILAGDRVINWEEDELREEWQNDKRQFTVFNRNTEEESKVKTGTLTDLNRLANLTGLKLLEIDDQPLKSLEGIEGMLELEEFYLKSCYQLNDISQLFTLENIRKIGLFSVPVSSIQGIQNLTKLQELKLHNTEVSDISPLAECDLTEANENGGLWLEILGSRVDTAPLESIKQFAYKQVEGQELDYSQIVNTAPEETEVPEKQGILPKLEDLVGMD